MNQQPAAESAPKPAPKPAYKRILLKISGEALMGDLGFGISPAVMTFLAHELKEIVDLGVQVALVVGAGNIFRGEGLARGGMDMSKAEYVGVPYQKNPAVKLALERGMGLTVTVPERGATISLKVFMASITQIVVFSSTTCPTFANGSCSGDAAR